MPLTSVQFAPLTASMRDEKEPFRKRLSDVGNERGVADEQFVNTTGKWTSGNAENAAWQHCN